MILLGFDIDKSSCSVYLVSRGDDYEFSKVILDNLGSVPSSSVTLNCITLNVSGYFLGSYLVCSHGSKLYKSWRLVLCIPIHGRGYILYGL